MNIAHRRPSHTPWLLFVCALTACICCSSMTVLPSARLQVAIIFCGAFDLLAASAMWLAYIYRKRKKLLAAVAVIALAIINFLILVDATDRTPRAFSNAKARDFAAAHTCAYKRNTNAVAQFHGKDNQKGEQICSWCEKRCLK